MAESIVNQPPTKRRKVCEHCGKDITIRYTESTGDCSITKATKRGLNIKKKQCRVVKLVQLMN